LFAAEKGSKTMNASGQKLNWPLGLLGAIVGGALGYFLFFLLTRIGHYALILPGGLLGLGGGLMLRGKSTLFGVLCGVSALGLSLFADWRFEPFIADRSFWYFLTHIHKFDFITLFMLVVGVLIAFWLGRGNERSE
jgi:hypothetical protein